MALVALAKSAEAVRQRTFAAMHPDDFFVETEGFDSIGDRRLNVELLEKLRRRPLPQRDDLEAATALARLVHDELETYGTEGGERLGKDGMALAIRSLRAALKRLDIQFDPEWRDYTTFRGYWIRKGARGSWQARRDLLASEFDPIHGELARREDQALANDLVEQVSPRGTTGWPKVDEEIRELRRRFRSAQTPQDYRAVGTHCVGVLEALSRTVYDPSAHLREGESPPPPEKTKLRIGRYVEDAAPGSSNEQIRGLVLKAVELAHEVKHRETPTRRDAGIAADSVIVLANLLRRLDQDF